MPTSASLILRMCALNTIVRPDQFEFLVDLNFAIVLFRRESERLARPLADAAVVLLGGQ